MKTGAVLLAALLLPGTLAAQRVQWTDAVYLPGRWQGGRVVAAPAESLALVMRIDYFANPPRWRAEIRRTTNGTTFGDPDILIGNGATAQVATQLGATPLARHALGRDSLVLAAAAVLDARGRRQGAATGRITERNRVVFRRTARSAAFNDALLNPGGRGGRQLIASGVQQVGDQRSATVVATAGARGVDRVQTPRGTVPVTPDTNAVKRMEAFSVGAARLEEFLRTGGLGAYRADSVRGQR